VLFLRGTRRHRLFEKKPSIVSLEMSSHALSPSVKCVGGGPKVCCWWSFLLFSFYFSLFQLKYKFILFIFLFFNSNPYVFYCLFLSVTLLKKVFYVFNSVLKLQFIIYCFHQFGCYSFELSFLSLDLLLKFY
jgi:hypothetical protein